MPTSSAAPIVSNRPKDDAFHQQRLKTWQPILSPMNVIIIFLAIGIIFIPTGIALNGTSNSVYEDTVTYDGINVKLTAPGPNTCLTGEACTVSAGLDPIRVCAIFHMPRYPPWVRVKHSNLTPFICLFDVLNPLNNRFNSL